MAKTQNVMPHLKHHTLPPDLAHCIRIDARTYRRWLGRKVAAHVRRDRKRKLKGVDPATYRNAIHDAVLRSGGCDHYTGESLDWTLVGRYDNDASRKGRHRYKARFALLPTVDHVDASASSASFVICAWRSNDAKNDLAATDFIDLCAKVLTHAGYVVMVPGGASRRHPSNVAKPRRLAT